MWQCGQIYYEKYKKDASNKVVIKPFISKMEQLYAAADFIISRAGAGSISELSCVGKPILLIPSPNVTANHQYRNAHALVKENASLMVEEKDLEEKFKKYFLILVSDESTQQELKQNLKRLSRPNATQNIIREIIQLNDN